MPTLPITPMTLGDMFDRLFKLIGKTWMRNLAIASLILFLPTVLMMIGMDTMFSSLQSFSEQGQGAPDIGSIAGFFGAMGAFFLAYIGIIVGIAAATLGVTIIGCEEFNGRFMTWQDALTQTFSIRILRMLGMFALQVLLIGGAIMIPYILMIVAIAADSTFFILIMVLLFLAAVGCVAYVLIRWSFAVPVLACENAGVIESLKRSWQLVDNNWWRIFGILFLFSLMLSFAVSLVMTPVYLFAMWDFFAAYFQLLSSGEPDPSAFTEIFSSFGLRFGIIFGLATILEMLVSPLVNVVLYFDLRARAGEFTEPSTPENLLFP
ncbi:MAG: glycerophosphoryl diester phosphodiesterase membrane domain-containing protein [Ignavibacteriae bacterium]|nr:glycerophosphoryl diester phosphodiesterase membrane domain-containing protein [Ignavibacteriota bacterium]